MMDLISASLPQWAVILTVAVLINALLFYNKRFQVRFIDMVGRVKGFVIWSAILFVLSVVLLGPKTINGFMPQIPGIIAMMFQGIFFAVFQIGIMLWAMGRPECEWSLPTDDRPDLNIDRDWIGHSEVKKQAKKLIECLQNWEMYARAGTKPPSGVTLFGPPGTGKTRLAKIIASVCKLPVVIISGTSLNGPFIGMGTLLVKGVMRPVRRLARKYGGIIVFIDEIDAIAMARAGMSGMGGNLLSNSGGMSSNGTLQTLLTEMSGAGTGESWITRQLISWGLKKRNHKPLRIMFMCATNIELNLLDPALLRSGRFGSVKLYVGFPPDECLEELYRYYFAGKNVEDDVDFEQLKKLSRRFTGADVEEITDAAARNAVFEGRTTVTFKDLWKQIREKKFGIPSPIGLHPDEKGFIADHEAGHAGALVRFPPRGTVCIGATLRRTEDYLAAVFHEADDETRSMQDREDLLRRIFVSVAARAVEEVKHGKKFSGVTGDMQTASAVALFMVGKAGMGEELWSNAATDGKPSASEEREAKLIVNAVYEFAKDYVRADKDAIDAISKRLVEETDLTGPAVIEIVNGFKPPKWETLEPEVDRYYQELKTKKRKETLELQLETAAALKAAKEVVTTE